MFPAAADHRSHVWLHPGLLLVLEVAGRGLHGVECYLDFPPPPSTRDTDIPYY